MYHFETAESREFSLCFSSTPFNMLGASCLEVSGINPSEISRFSMNLSMFAEHPVSILALQPAEEPSPFVLNSFVPKTQAAMFLFVNFHISL